MVPLCLSRARVCSQPQSRVIARVRELWSRLRPALCSRVARALPALFHVARVCVRRVFARRCFAVLVFFPRSRAVSARCPFVNASHASVAQVPDA